MTFIRGSANKGSRSFIAIHFSKKFAARLDELCVMHDCVNTDWEGEITDGGDIVTIRNFGDITWSDYSPDSTTLTYSTVAESSRDLVIDQMKYFAFKIDDVDKAQTDFQVTDAYIERAAISGKELVDTFLLTSVAASVPVDNTLGATALGNVIHLTPENIYSVFTDLYTLLEDSKVFAATNQMPWLVVPPVIKGIMRKAPEFTKASDLGDQVVRNGVIGEFAGFEVKCTTNMSFNPPATGTDGYWNVLAGVNMAYSFAQQVNEVESVRLEGGFHDAERGLMLYGGKDVLPQGLAKAVVKAA